MFWADIMTSFGPMCVVTSAIARFIPIFKLAYFWNAKTYTNEILIWRHIDGVLSEKPQNTHNQYSLFFNGCIGWKFKNCWNDWYMFATPHWCVFLFSWIYICSYSVVCIANHAWIFQIYILIDWHKYWKTLWNDSRSNAVVTAIGIRIN